MNTLQMIALWYGSLASLWLMHAHAIPGIPSALFPLITILGLTALAVYSLGSHPANRRAVAVAVVLPALVLLALTRGPLAALVPASLVQASVALAASLVRLISASVSILAAGTQALLSALAVIIGTNPLMRMILAACVWFVILRLAYAICIRPFVDWARSA